MGAHKKITGPLAPAILLLCLPRSKCWWHPYDFPFNGKSNDELESWLWDEEIIPPFESLLQVENPIDDKRWLVLHGYVNFRNEQPIDVDKTINQKAWYRIHSCIVRRKDLSRLEEQLRDKDFRNSRYINIDSTFHQGFLGEYPWHQMYKSMKRWTGVLGDRREFEIDHLVPTAIYEWEHGSTDYSLEASLSIYVPSIEVVESLELSSGHSRSGEWKNDKGNTIFCDPSVISEGPSCALMESEALVTWLAADDLELVWLVSGEKCLSSESSTGSHGNLVYNGMYKLINGEIKGNIWFKKESPDGI